MGRPRTCECGACQKCRNREKARRWYNALSPEERREYVGRRDKEKLRAADQNRNSTPERIAHLTANSARWRREHPEAVSAHNKVARAIKSGKLVRGPCEECPPGRTGRVHAHHDDYSKPLDVRWLCPRHHAAVTLLRKDNP